MDEFILKTKIYAGTDSCEKIREYMIEKAFIFCDPFILKSKKTDLIVSELHKIHADYRIFADVIPDPDMTVIQKGLNQLNQFRPDTVFAIGGGSAIDTAKAVVHLYTMMNQLEKPQMIAIPTTSGTGSEVTSFAVISDHDAGTKYPLIDPSLVPDVVFLDPMLTATVPPGITADTGMDVLTHALEAYVSVKANDFTDAMAEKAMRTVRDYLERCVTDGGDLEAREHMHNASCMAGAAFNTASLGICHSMAHALGAQFHIPHGRCNAILLPMIMEYNAGLIMPGETDALLRYLEIAGIFGISGRSNKAAIYALTRQIRELMRRIGIPLSFSELNIDKEEYMNAIERMTESALKDRCTVTNPRRPEAEHIRQLFRRAYD
ncbi:MAG: 1-propanol dehydrogenase PduQ [Lachnospiraceae bacterium]